MRFKLLDYLNFGQITSVYISCILFVSVLPLFCDMISISNVASLHICPQGIVITYMQVLHSQLECINIELVVLLMHLIYH